MNNQSQHCTECNELHIQQDTKVIVHTNRIQISICGAPHCSSCIGQEGLAQKLTHPTDSENHVHVPVVWLGSVAEGV